MGFQSPWIRFALDDPVEGSLVQVGGFNPRG